MCSPVSPTAIRPVLPPGTMAKVAMLVTLWCAGTVIVRPSQAQSIRLRHVQLPLGEAIRSFERATEWTAIYADRIVSGRFSTCTYEGTSAVEAMACILQGTGIIARQSGDRQFVLSEVRQRRLGALAGFVRDARTGEPLPGAHVVLPDLRIGAATTSAGFFSFPSLPVGPHRLRITFIGFAALDTLVATGPDPRFFGLKASTILSENVLIESPASERADLGMVPGLISIPVRRLQQLPTSLGGQDLLEALKWLPGIMRASEVTGGLVVRGSGPDQNLYLVDGAPVYHPWHAFSLVSTFETESFRQIRMYRGSFPAEFGGRLSAVLDTELSDGKRPEPRAVASVNALAARFLIESPITQKSSFMLAGRRSYIDQLIGRRHPVSDAQGRRDTLRTGYYFYDWSAKVALRPDKDSRVSISYYVAGDDLDLRLPFDLSLDRSSWLRPADFVFEIGESWRNELVSVRFERLLAADWFVTATGYRARYRADEAAFVQPSLSADVRSDYSVDLGDLGASVDFDYYRSLAHQFRAGVSVAHRAFDSEVDATISYAPGVSERLQQGSTADALETAVYVQDVWRPSALFQMVSGLRGGFFGSGRYLRLSPRVSVQVTLDPKLLVAQVALSRNNQFLHRVRDRYSYLYDLVSSRWVPSTPDVRPAEGTQVAFGVESRPIAGLELRAGSYVRRAHDILLPRDEYRTKDGLAGPGIEVGTLLGQYTTGSERSVGLEFEATYDRLGWLLSGAYTHSRAYTRSDLETDRGWRPSRYDVPRMLDVVARRRGTRWEGGVALSWRSGYPITVPVARYELSDPAGGAPTTYLHRPELNNGRLPPYFRLDADVAYRFSGWGAAWLFRIQLYNVLDRRNLLDRAYAPDGLTMSSQDRSGLPRIPLFELRVEL